VHLDQNGEVHFSSWGEFVCEVLGNEFLNIHFGAVLRFGVCWILKNLSLRMHLSKKKVQINRKMYVKSWFPGDLTHMGIETD